MKIGWSEFAVERHKPGTGLSFFTISHDDVVTRVVSNWEKRQPGQGETGIDRKVVVPIDANGFFTNTVALRDDLPLRAQVVRRQPGEDPYVEVYLDSNDALELGISPTPAKFCSIVCYSADALQENGGRITDHDWEIVAVLASDVEKESMEPLTMARNFLEMVGGTKSVYSAEEFAVAIYEHSKRGIKIKSK